MSNVVTLFDLLVEYFDVDHLERLWKERTEEREATDTLYNFYKGGESFRSSSSRLSVNVQRSNDTRRYVDSFY